MANPVTAPEWWQRGPLPGIAPLFQPAAHAMLQARDELLAALDNFPKHLLWVPLHGMASVGFHLRHIPGVLDRLFTYAKEESISEQQLIYLKAEGQPDDNVDAEQLLQVIITQVDKCLEEMSHMKEDAATAVRYIGRKKIPTTQLGLVFHSAEHMMRHTGQLLVTVKVLKAQNNLP